MKHKTYTVLVYEEEEEEEENNFMKVFTNII